MSNIIIICLVLVIAISVPLSSKRAYRKGVEAGRDQVLNENIIRLQNDIHKIERERESLGMDYAYKPNGGE